MNDIELYKDFIRERKESYGSKRVKQEKSIRKKEFFRKKNRIEQLIKDAKEKGLNREETEKYIDKNLSSDLHIYGSFVFIVVEVIISWLIKRLLDRYFDG